MVEGVLVRDSGLPELHESANPELLALCLQLIADGVPLALGELKVRQLPEACDGDVEVDSEKALLEKS